jgi:hypothetical protein
MPPRRNVELNIEFKEGAEPVSNPVFRLSSAEQNALKSQIELLLEKRFILPSVNRWGAPVLFAPKKDGGLRMCLDYRALNKLTVKDKWPIPRVYELFDRLHGATHFSNIELRSGYYQIRVREGDVPKTCIRTRYGFFEFLVMPFGLTNVPSTFQALMNEVFRDYIDNFILVYLDDVLIFSRSEEEHKYHVEMVLQRLRDEKLFVKLSKCEFSKSSVSFLGHIVGANGLQMEEKKVEAVVKWPRPTTKVEVQSFVGFANYYRRFIKVFSHMAAPLSNLTRKKVPVNWIEPHEVAFDALKTSFTTAPVLKLPDPTKPYVVKNDASTSGIGAVLEQEDEDGLHPVAFASRKLQPGEVSYRVHDLELMAIVYALSEWRVYLHGVSLKLRQTIILCVTWIRSRNCRNSRFDG